jgi:hypothetical protein
MNSLGGSRAHIAKRFKASEFWAEARAAGATSTQFIGAMPDFLLNQEPSPDREQAGIVVRR